MPFFRPLSETAPRADKNLPWPLAGLAYVVTFMGPPSAGLILGVSTKRLSVSIVGLLLGAGIMCINGWFMDNLIEPFVARFQRSLIKPVPNILLNIGFFAWAILLCAIAMLAPIAIFGFEVLNHIR